MENIVKKFDYNGREYVVFESEDSKYIGAVHKYRVHMTDGNGMHICYTSRLESGYIESLFIGLGVIREDCPGRGRNITAEDFRQAVRLLNTSCYEDGTGVDDSEIEYAIKYHDLK